MAELSKEELEATLERLKRLFVAAARDYNEKSIQLEKLGRESAALGESMRNLKGSIAMIERALGVSSGSEQMPLPQPLEVKAGKSFGASEAAMKIVAAKNDSGGITFDGILQALHDQGHKVTREYMHTILNRKKNYQKKLVREKGRWFLTDRGRQELGME